MAITFDGPAKLAILSLGTTVLNVPDLYSRWKDWVASGNAQYLPAFFADDSRAIGGDVIDAGAGSAIPFYDFLTNGWRIRPQEADHTLNVTGGILLVDGGGDPFVDTLGDFTVRINYQQPVQAITVATGGGSGGLTPEQATRLLEIWQRLGLDPNNPVAQSQVQIAFASVVMALTESAGTVTVTRQ